MVHGPMEQCNSQMFWAQLFACSPIDRLKAHVYTNCFVTPNVLSDDVFFFPQVIYFFLFLLYPFLFFFYFLFLFIIFCFRIPCFLTLFFPFCFPYLPFLLPILFFYFKKNVRISREIYNLFKGYLFSVYLEDFLSTC